jgi:hypothetical protein
MNCTRKSFSLKILTEFRAATPKEAPEILLSLNQSLYVHHSVHIIP